MFGIFRQFDVWAAIDVALIAIIVYQMLLLVRGTRSGQMLVGMAILTAAFLASNIVPLTALNWIMSKFFSSLIIIVIIIFQEDIRLVLSKMGRRSPLTSTELTLSHYIIDEVTQAATNLAAKKIGALIAIERNIKLSRYIDLGNLMDARVSRDLILSIFLPNSPIHDGSIIIQEGRLASAGCFLPLSRREDLDPKYGTRHRAAIGMSQETDAVVVTVSEERGTMSIAVDGILKGNLSPEQLRETLSILLIEDNDEEPEGVNRFIAYYRRWFGAKK